MEKFGLKNFRRFDEQADINLGKINLLVGKNNSGKSSFIKGFILMMDNLKHLKMGREDGNQNIFANMPLFHAELDKELELHLGDLEKMNNCKQKGDKIVFSYTFTVGDKDFTIQLTIAITENKKRGALSEIVMSNGELSISFKPNQPISGEPFGDAIVTVNEKDYPVPILGDYIDEVSPYVFTKICINVSQNFRKRFGDDTIFAEITENMESLATKLQEYISDVDYYYIPSFYATHELKYTVGSYHYKVISDFHRSRITEGDKEHIFILDMMKEFEIGEKFSISIDSDMAEINIVDEQGNCMPLSFKGTGSVRMFFMLLILATCLRKQEQSQIIPIITIEEPEQNLHPMMQSKLAYLFRDFTKLSRPQTKLFIETHSEYLIRKTQVMAKKFCNEGNAIENFEFKTYYFPSSDDVKRKPYDMRYCEDGRFYERFGFGFFDEAAELAMQIF
jgi:predicted ATPase